MNSIEILKELIKIPSWVDSSTNESGIGMWIYKFLKENTKLKVRKQFLDKKRFNVIATKGIPNLWLGGHMDTVEISNKQQTTFKIEKNKIFGRGSVDMKGGIAAILEAISSLEDVDNVGLFFYCDEEYFFAGMKRFLASFSGKPKLTVIAEPTNLMISNAHRGLIDFRAVVKGKSCHASRPQEGTDAIQSAIFAAKETARILESKYSSKDNGVTTFVVSQIKGGLQVGTNKNKEILYGKGTNIVSDTAEISVDIRTAVVGLKAGKIISLYEKCLKSLGAKLTNVDIKIDLGSLLTPKKKLAVLEGAVFETVGKVGYIPSSQMGYGDGQMFFEKTGFPVVYFGPGPTEMCHKENEFVDIDSLKKTVEVFKKLLQKKP